VDLLNEEIMKITHILECAGGVERYLEMLASRLTKKGFEQTIVCSHSVNLEKLKDSAESCYVTDMRQTFNPLAVIKIIKQVRRAIRVSKPDIVYCHSSFAGVFGRLAAIVIHCKVVYNPHGWAFNMRNTSAMKLMVFRKMEQIFANLTDKIVCISEAELKSAMKNHISKEDKLELIPNGIDIDAVRSAVPVKRSELGISDDAFVVGMVGRLSAQKAPDVFIRAAELIHKEIPNSAFIIVGDGEQREEIEEFSRVHGLNLVVTGWTDMPYSYLKTFDVAMLLSRWEGFGLAIVEYMAAEKNVVATRTDAIPSLVDDGVDGFLVDVDNAEQAADKLLWLHKHPKEAMEMRGKALQKVVKKYDINRVINQHIDMFNELIPMGGQNKMKY
jgi:glycosyltransferase involved in cell wall biosynthesis